MNTWSTDSDRMSLDKLSMFKHQYMIFDEFVCVFILYTK